MLSGTLLKKKVTVSGINEEKLLEKISEQTASGINMAKGPWRGKVNPGERLKKKKEKPFG